MLKKFCLSLSLGIALTALVFTISSCGSDSNPSKPSGESSSSAYTEEEPIVVSDANYEISQLDFDWKGGPSGERKVVKMEVEVIIKSSNPEDKKFDSVLVRLITSKNGTTVNTDKQKGNEGGASASGLAAGRITFVEKDDNYKVPFETCGETLELRVIVYAKGKTDAVAYEKKTLEGHACTPAGGVLPSSSSAPAVSKTLTKVKSDVTINSTNGVNLSDGTNVAAASADIYCDKNRSLRTNKETVTMLSNFDKGNYCETITNGNVDNPTKTDDFIPCSLNEFFKFNDPAKNNPIGSGFYFIVRTNNTTSWGSGWYLVLYKTSSTGTSDNQGMVIDIWKVN